jgi:hypothetical protein
MANKIRARNQISLEMTADKAKIDEREMVGTKLRDHSSRSPTNEEVIETESSQFKDFQNKLFVQYNQLYEIYYKIIDE